MSGILTPLLVSLQVASVATLAVLPPGIALGLLLARREFPGKALVETLIALPLVLPPTAVGYALLRALARGGPLGAPAGRLDLLFTWRGAALASAVMALPLVARTARVAFGEIDPRLESMARTLGLPPARAFLLVTLPLAARGLAAAGVLGFGRALGEFGATVIVAGNIPGRTRTLALAIFSEMQTGDDAGATWLLGVTVVLAFVVLWVVERLTRRRGAPGGGA